MRELREVRGPLGLPIERDQHFDADKTSMMLEEVYAVAPGANLLFCGSDNSTEYIACVQDLVAAGALIITDDIATPGDDLMSPYGSIASAVQATLAAYPNISLFTAAGNFNQSYWQGNYSASSLASAGYAPLTCSSSGQVDYYIQSFNGAPDEVLNVNQAGTYGVKFQWSDPFDANVSNFDVYLYDVATGITQCFDTTNYSATSYYLSLPLNAGQYQIYIGTPDGTAGGKMIKLLVDESLSLSYSTAGSVVSPQAFVPGVMTVGAVIGSDGIGTTIESYSAQGPIHLIYPPPGEISQAPMLVAPDDIYVDLNGTHFSTATWPDGNFHGTSAASPNAAAVAALLRSAFPTLTPGQLNSYLQAVATSIGSVPNTIFGYGRVDALGALAQIPGPTLTGLQGTTIVGGSSSHPLPFTFRGVGTLKVTVLPGASMSAVVTPSNCGSLPGSCSLTVTPAIGAAGSFSVQVNVADGANRSMSYLVPITVTKPAPPAISITSGATQSVQVNAAFAPIAISLSGTGPITVSANYNGAPVALTSGCGTTVMTCSINLGSAGTVTGPQSLNVTAQDSYGQSSFTSTTVTITNPPPPTIMITSGATQSVMVNAAIAPVAFTLTGTGSLTVTPATSGITALTISSGCGTTTMSCTASLGMAQSTAGTATLTLTVEDSYVQSAAASATITENAPPASSSGGGALDPWALLGLSGLVLVQLNRAQRNRR